MEAENIIYCPENAEILTRLWVERIVVGLNLCPFAAPVVQKSLIEYCCSDAETEGAFRVDLLGAMDRLQQTPEEKLSTIILITPYYLQNFHDYLDALEEANGLLKASGLEGILQIASFHPAYQFYGTEEGDITNWTNRAPFPSFHLIREEEMSRAIEHFQNVEEIPQRNMARLQALGSEGLTQRYPWYQGYCRS